MPRGRIESSSTPDGDASLEVAEAMGRALLKMRAKGRTRACKPVEEECLDCFLAYLQAKDPAAPSLSE